MTLLLSILTFISSFFYTPIVQGATILSVPQGGTGSSTLSGILIGTGGTNSVKTLTVGSNLTLTGTTLSASASGGVGNWFTPQTWGNSTSSILGFPGFISSGSSTLSTLGTGGLAVNNGLIYNAATSTFNSPLTYANGSVSCAACLTANQTIILSGVVTGSGATAITTVFGTMNQGVLANPAFSATIPTPQATSTLYGPGTAGKVLTIDSLGNAGWAATTTFSGGTGITLATAGNAITIMNAGVLTTRNLTIAGTANQVTSSAGAQDLSSDRTWTLSLPSHVIFPTSFQASLATITNATTTNLSVTSSSTLATMFGAGLSACTGTSALTWSAGLFTCTAQPQGTVTAVNGTANQIDSSGGATPTLSLSNHVIFPASFQALRGTTTNATSTNLSVIGSSTVGTTFNVGSAIQDNGSLVVNGQTTLASSLSGLALLTSGVVSAYGGAAACTNQFVTAISSVGGTTCATLTGAAFGTVSANTWFGNPTGVAATPGFNATSTIFTGTAGQNAIFTGTGLLVGTSSLFVNTSTGNVGIDDTTPDFNLEIATANSNGYFGVTNVNDGDVFLINNSTLIGVATTSPWGLFSINPTFNNSTGPAFVVGSSTKTLFIVNPNGTVGIASSSPNPFWGVTVATSTAFSSQVGSLMASSTAQAALYNVDWNTGNTQSFILNQNTELVINSTSSHPVPGFSYYLKVCQDGTGSRTFKIINYGQIAWWNGTTTITATPNRATWFGMKYDGRTLHYDLLASSTNLTEASCLP